MSNNLGLVPRQVSFGAKVIAVALAPVAFWVLATGTDLARHRPDALETPLLWLAAAWAFYLPIFAVASITPVAVGRYFGVPTPRYLSAILCGSIAAAITKTMVTSSVAAVLSAIVGVVLGALLAD